MLVIPLTFLIVVVQLQFSVGNPVTNEAVAAPVPMPDFQIQKSYGVWYVKLMLLGKKVDLKCARVENTQIDENSFQSSANAVLGNGTLVNRTTVHTLKTPGVNGVYKVQSEEIKDPLTMTFLDTDYETYAVYLFFKSKDHQAVTVVGKSPTGALPEETVDKIKKLLEDQKIDVSAGFRTTDETATC